MSSKMFSQLSVFRKSTLFQRKGHFSLFFIIKNPHKASHMAPKKKNVSFVKSDKVSVDTAKKQAEKTKKKQPVAVKKAKKEQPSKINRLAAASKIAAAPAGKKNKKSSGGGNNKKKAGAKKDASKKKVAQKGKKKVAPYVALQLRNLPDAFQEPQLRKFLSQFGVPIAQMFVQRTLKRAKSRGLAYIRFSPKEISQEKTLDVILEECNAMNLGGKTVGAKWVTMTHLMPSRRATDARRQIEYVNKTQGIPLDQHDTRHFDWVARLRRGAKNENAGNKFLKSIGVNYSFSGFNDQLPLLTKEIKETSNKAQKSVKMTRLASKLGRRKGFTNTDWFKKVLSMRKNKKKQRRERMAAKNKEAKKEAPTTGKTTSPARRSTSPVKAASAKKKVVAKK